MFAEISHFLKGTINFLVKFRIIQKIGKKLIFQGMKTYQISSKRNYLNTGNSMNDASANELYRIQSFICSRAATQRPAWPQDKAAPFVLSSSAPGRWGPRCVAPSWCWREGRELGEGGTFLRLDHLSAALTLSTPHPTHLAALPWLQPLWRSARCRPSGPLPEGSMGDEDPLRTPPRSRRRDEERTWAPGGPVPVETYRMPGGGPGAIHTWQVADTGKYNISAMGGGTKRFDNHLH